MKYETKNNLFDIKKDWEYEKNHRNSDEDYDILEKYYLNKFDKFDNKDLKKYIVKRYGSKVYQETLQYYDYEDLIEYFLG